MSITIDRETLSSALAVAARVAAGHYTELRLTALKGTLVVSATDLRHWLDISLPCEGELEAVCVHAQRLNEVVASMFGERVGLKLDGQLILKGEKGVRRLSTVSADEWPTREFEAKTTVTVEADRLREALHFVFPNIAPASDLAKAHMAGVHLLAESGKLKAFGSDAFNLTIAEIGDCTAEIAATITPQSGAIIDRLAEGKVEIGLSKSASEFRWPGGRVLGPLIEGDYPIGLIKKLFTLEYTSAVSVEAKELLRAIRSVRAIGYQDSLSRSTGVKLTLNGSASLGTSSSEGGAEQEFVADWDGEGEVAVGFASARMEKLLCCFGDSVLSIGLKNDDPMAPLKFEAFARPDRLALLFPMRI